MPQYRLSRDITIPKGTEISYEAPTTDAPVTFGYAAFDPNGTEPDGWNLTVASFAVALDEAIDLGLVEEFTPDA